MSLKNRTLTKREKTLLNILLLIVVIAAYWLLVQIPVSDGIKTAQSDIDLYSTENVVLENKIIKQSMMEEELEALAASGEMVEIAPYDNLSTVMSFLNKTFASTNNFRMSFTDAVDNNDSSIIRRNVKISFESGSYMAAKRVIQKLEDCDFLCRIDSLSISPKVRGNSIIDSGVEVSLSVTFYERVF